MDNTDAKVAWTNDDAEAMRSVIDALAADLQGNTDLSTEILANLNPEQQALAANYSYGLALAAIQGVAALAGLSSLECLSFAREHLEEGLRA